MKTKTKTYTRLSAEERSAIHLLYHQGKGSREIARRLGRFPNTIRYEINRKTRTRKGGYCPVEAQEQARQLRHQAKKKRLDNNPWLELFIIEQLKEGWTPERISGYLQHKYPHIRARRLSHEAIYRFIYSKRGRRILLSKYLPYRKRRRGNRRAGKQLKSPQIKHRTPISKRPVGACNRSRFGHYETDSMFGKRGCSLLTVAIERKSRKLFIQRSQELKASCVIESQKHIISQQPRVKSMTFDNGKENAYHMQIQSMGIPTFFTDPYSAYQKGSIENAIGLLRRYIPKRSDIDAYSDDDLQQIAERINNWPKKCLGYRTPNQEFARLSKRGVVK